MYEKYGRMWTWSVIARQNVDKGLDNESLGKVCYKGVRYRETFIKGETINEKSGIGKKSIIWILDCNDKLGVHRASASRNDFRIHGW